MNSVLVFEQDPSIARQFRQTLSNWGYQVEVSYDVTSVLSLLAQKTFPITFANIAWPGLDSEKLFTDIKAQQPQTEIILMAPPMAVSQAIAMIKRGAYDFVLKPPNFDQVQIILERCLDKISKQKVCEPQADNNSEQTDAEKLRYDRIIGKNHKMQEIYQLIQSLKDIDSTVMITGETGTGKGLLANTIHLNSHRKDGSFITVDCGAIPETLLESELFGYEKGAFTGAIRRRLGKFELAHKGTIFLDEIGDVPLHIQQKLLRILQERRFERLGAESSVEVDVRVVTATNKDLKKMVEDGTFREDLFYRLNIIPIHLPPLRERMDDLVLLITHFMEKYREKLQRDVRTISQDAINSMMRYHWPGNIREMENLMERAIIMTPGKDITKIDIPGERRNKDIYSFGKIDTNLPLKQVKKEIIEQVERKYIAEMLKRHRGNINLVARQSKIDNKTLYEKMRQYNYSKEEFKQLSV